MTSVQRETYLNVGFVVLRNALPAIYTSKLQQWAKALEELPETPGKWMKYFEVDKSTGKRLLCRVENFIPYFQDIRECALGYLTDVGSDCLGEQSVIYKEKLNFKFPHGNGFTAHQDQPAYATFGFDSYTTILVPVDPNTRQSGGLDFAPNQNQREVLPQNSDGGIRTDIEARMHWTPVDVYPGDVVAFDSYSPHRSDVNLSTFTRRNLYFTYNSLSLGSLRDKYYADKRANFPPEIERDPTKDYSAGARIYNVANPIK